MLSALEKEVVSLKRYVAVQRMIIVSLSLAVSTSLLGLLWLIDWKAAVGAWAAMVASVLINGGKGR